MINSGSEDEQGRPTKHKAKSQNAKTVALKAELKHLLSQPLIAKGISTRYITSGSRPIVDDLIAGECKLCYSIQSYTTYPTLDRPRSNVGLEESRGWQ